MYYVSLPRIFIWNLMALPPYSERLDFDQELDPQGQLESRS